MLELLFQSYVGVMEFFELHGRVKCSKKFESDKSISLYIVDAYVLSALISEATNPKKILERALIVQGD